MRISISNKVFILFLTVSVITMMLGASTYFGIERLQQGAAKLDNLTEFQVQIKILEQFHLAKDAESMQVVSERLQKEIGKAEKLALIIKQYKADLSHDMHSVLADLDQHIGFYEKAILELFKLEDLSQRFRDDNYEILQRLFAVIAKNSREVEVNFKESISHLQYSWITLNFYKRSESIPELKKFSSAIKQLSNNSQIHELVDTFVTNSEKFYLNSLAVLDRQEFLSETSDRFFNLAESAIERLNKENLEKQIRIRHAIITLVGVGIIATLFFWVLASQRIQRFMLNLNQAIRSIKSGDYDYKVGKVSNDELGDLILFMKKMAYGFKEKITELKQSEQEKQELQNQLFHSQKIESIGMLAGGIAHDFNNLLTSINGYSELALMQLPRDHQVREYVQAIFQSGIRAEGLTKQLLAFSRRQVLEMHYVNLNTIIDNVAKMISRIVGEDVVIKFNKEAQLRNILADSGQLEQVLMNLVVNARDSMPTGGYLTIGTAEINENSKKHTLDLEERGDYALLSVADTGAGMSQEVQDKIFDPFFTTKEIGKGTGLGLATAYGIVKQHNGHIAVESELGTGTEFKIYFPIVNGSETPLVKDRTPGVDHGNETVLLVDDESGVRKMIKDMLSPMGYQLLQAADGDEALLIHEQTDGPIHLLLTDVVMPGMNGKELAGVIKKDRPELKVIFMSGYTDHKLDSEDIFASEGMAFIQKPITPSKLMAIIQEVLWVPQNEAS